MNRITNNQGLWLGGVFVTHNNTLEFIFTKEDGANLYNNNDAGVLCYILNKFYGGNWNISIKSIEPITPIKKETK